MVKKSIDNYLIHKITQFFEKNKFCMVYKINTRHTFKIIIKIKILGR